MPGSSTSKPLRDHHLERGQPAPPGWPASARAPAPHRGRGARTRGGRARASPAAAGLPPAAGRLTSPSVGERCRRPQRGRRPGPAHADVVERRRGRCGSRSSSSRGDGANSVQASSPPSPARTGSRARPPALRATGRASPSRGPEARPRSRAGCPRRPLQRGLATIVMLSSSIGSSRNGPLETSGCCRCQSSPTRLAQVPRPRVGVGRGQDVGEVVARLAQHHLERVVVERRRLLRRPRAGTPSPSSAAGRAPTCRRNRAPSAARRRSSTRPRAAGRGRSGRRPRRGSSRPATASRSARGRS